MARYLLDNYTRPGGGPLDATLVNGFLNQHEAIMREAIDFLSYAYYVGDKIAAIENLEWIQETDKGEDS